MIEYTPLQYLQIDLANQCGLDHTQFEDRIQWVMEHERNLELFAPEAKDFFRYTAALQAYRDAQAGKPIGYLVGLDAAASGIAILGALTGCTVTAANTGIIGAKRKDVYDVCTESMRDLLGSEIEVLKDDVKKSLMTSYYGSKATPKNVFGKDTPELHAFYQAAEMVAPGASAMKNALLLAWQPFVLEHSWTMPDGFEVNIPVLQTMETKLEIDELDHLSIKMLYEDNVGTEKGLSLVANVTHACDALMVREVARRCNYDKEFLMNMENNLTIYLNDNSVYKYKYTPAIEQLWKDHEFLSLVGIEYLNEESVKDFGHDYLNALLELITQTLKKPSFEVLFIHDEYLSHPNYMNYVRGCVIDVLAAMADSNIPSHILTQIIGEPTQAPTLSHNLGDAIRRSEYIIT